MAIKQGDKIPSVKLKRSGANGLEEFDTAQEIKGKKVMLVGMPGAFTGSCQKHLPGYVSNADALKSKGFDDIIVVTVNDPFVMAEWGAQAKAQGKVSLWPDGNGAFAQALGLTFDGSGAGLGTRFQRFSAVVNDGLVESLTIEAKPSDVDLTSAACMLDKAAA